jgi:hypothetical protein
MGVGLGVGLEGLDEGHVFCQAFALGVLEQGICQFLIMGLQLGNFGDELILLLAHAFEFLLHDGVLIDDGVLRLELVIVPLVVFLLLLVDLDPGKR